jgi:hypothetical protein
LNDLIFRVKMKYELKNDSKQLKDFNQVLKILSQESINNYDYQFHRFINLYGLNFLNENVTRAILKENDIIFYPYSKLFNYYNNPDRGSIVSDEPNESLSEFNIINENISWLPKVISIKNDYFFTKRKQGHIHFDFDQNIKCENIETTIINDEYLRIKQKMNKILNLISEGNHSELFEHIIYSQKIEENRVRFWQISLVEDYQLSLLIPLRELAPEIIELIQFQSSEGHDEKFSFYLKSRYKQLIFDYIVYTNNRYLLSSIADEIIKSIKTTDTKNQIDLLFFQKNMIQGIKSVIYSAQKFLLIASYIIEDIDITDLIISMKKRKNLMVFVITSYTQRIFEDNRKNDFENKNERSRYLDNLKIICLTKLLEAGCIVKYSDIHFKAILSENDFYIGSANLTRGSLYHNYECGIVSSKSTENSCLIKIFETLWLNHSSHILSEDGSEQIKAIEVKERKHSDGVKITHQNILGVYDYYQQIKNKLNKNDYSRLLIFTWNVNIDPGIRKLLLKNKFKVQIFYGNEAKDTDEFISVKINHLHAKAVLFDDSDLFLGGIDFLQNPSNENALIDFMYYTNTKNIITQFLLEYWKIYG